MQVGSNMARIVGSGLFSGPKRSLRSLTDRLEGLPRLGKERRHQRVRWIEGPAPDSEEAETIRDALTANGSDTWAESARPVADRLFRKDHAAAGRVAAIGLFHGWYVLHACASPERFHGRVVRTADGTHPWT
jgi:hypothetical protein